MRKGLDSIPMLQYCFFHDGDAAAEEKSLGHETTYTNGKLMTGDLSSPSNKFFISDF